jgi:fructose-1,6-bisphosphatase/inositol monophosphatase family enzyme
MAKTVTVNPKITVIRKVLAATRPALLRGMGTLARVSVTPKTAETEATKLADELKAILVKGLSGGKEAILAADAPIPAEGAAWLIFPLTHDRNAIHALPWCGSAVLYVRDGRTLAGGILLASMEEAFIVCAGEGASAMGLGRCRTSGRLELKDAMVGLPRSSGDAAKLKLLELAEEHTFHTRKTGCPVADLLMVATGQLDAMVVTKATPLEQGLIELTMSESGGVAKVLNGTLVAGTPKVVIELMELLK